MGIYGLGMSYRHISSHIEQIYDMSISYSVLTDRIIPQIKSWQSRMLDSVYTIVWLDALHFKVRDNGVIVHKAIYKVIGVNKDGYKDLLEDVSLRKRKSQLLVERFNGFKQPRC